MEEYRTDKKGTRTRKGWYQLLEAATKVCLPGFNSGRAGEDRWLRPCFAERKVLAIPQCELRRILTALLIMAVATGLAVTLEASNQVSIQVAQQEEETAPAPPPEEEPPLFLPPCCLVISPGGQLPLGCEEPPDCEPVPFPPLPPPPSPGS